MRARHRWPWVVVFALVLAVLGGCGSSSDDAPADDAARNDATPDVARDSSVLDGDASDGKVSDGTVVDSGAPDGDAHETANDADANVADATDATTAPDVAAETMPDVVISDAGSDTSVPAVGLCSAGGWCWLDPLPHGNHQYSVWGTGPHDVWTVGEVGAIAHYDGTRWARIDSGTDAQLRSLSGTGPSDVWTVGSGGTILHWNGTAWSRSPVPAGVTGLLTQVFAISPTDVWVVGDHDTVLHGDGSTWTLVTLPISGDPHVVWASSATDVWIGVNTTGGYVGWVGVVRWNGTTWTTALGDHSSLGAMLSSITGTGPNDVWVADWMDRYHWDGATFTRTDSTGPTLLSISAIAEASDHTAFATGGYEGTEVQRWDGHAWAPAPIPGVSGGSVSWNLSGLWAAAPDDVYAVGLWGRIFHWNGTGWSDAVPGHFDNLNALWAASTTDAWVVGDGGIVLHGDGTSWTAVDSGTTSKLLCVHGRSATDVWAGGENDTLIHWDGTHWSSITGAPAVSGADFGQVHVFADGTVDVLSENPDIVTAALLRYDAGTWTSKAIAHGALGMFALAPNDVWISTDDGFVSRYDGSAWTDTYVSGTDSLHAIWATSDGNVWAAGTNDQFYQGSGTSWHRVPSPTLHPDFSASVIQQITGSGPNDIWAVGTGGIVEHYDGTAWTLSPSPALQTSYGMDLTILTGNYETDLGGVWSFGPGSVWVAGLYGGILRYGP